MNEKRRGASNSNILSSLAAKWNGMSPQERVVAAYALDGLALGFGAAAVGLACMSNVAIITPEATLAPVIPTPSSMPGIVDRPYSGDLNNMDQSKFEKLTAEVGLSEQFSQTNEAFVTKVTGLLPAGIDKSKISTTDFWSEVVRADDGDIVTRPRSVLYSTIDSNGNHLNAENSIFTVTMDDGSIHWFAYETYKYDDGKIIEIVDEVQFLQSNSNPGDLIITTKSDDPNKRFPIMGFTNVLDEQGNIVKKGPAFGFDSKLNKIPAITLNKNGLIGVVELTSNKDRSILVKTPIFLGDDKDFVPGAGKVQAIANPYSTAIPPTEAAPATAGLLTISELGVQNPDFIKAFEGATFTKEADGTFSVNAISYNGETKVEGKYIIDSTSFSNNPDIKNAYAPATVVAKDSLGNQVTLIWDSEHGNWRMPFAMVDNSDFSKVDQIPFVPEGDEKIAIESALLYFQGHPPFSDAAVQNYLKSGGNSLLFEYLEGYGKRVSLKSKGDDNPNLTQENATMKNSPLWVKMNVNGVMQDINLIVNLDGPNPDEYKVFFGVSGVILKNLSPANKQERIDVLSGKVKPGPVYLFLFGDADYQKYDDLLAKLLALPGNDPGKLDFFVPAMGYVGQLSSTNTPLETAPYAESLPPEIQLMLLRSP